MLMRKMLVLAAAQVAKGTPATPTPGSNAILAMTAMPNIINGEFVQREVLSVHQGSPGGFWVGEHRALDFEVELAGSGAAGTAPPVGDLLISCGAQETVVEDTSVAYSLIGSGEPYMTLWCYLDEVLFKVEDAKLSYAVEYAEKRVGRLKFRGMGTYQAMTDANIPTNAVYTAFQDPLTFGKVNTPTFTVHGAAVKPISASFDLGREMQWRDLPNEQGVAIPNRMATANLAYELTTVATKAWGEQVRTGAKGAVQIVHGTAPGNIVQLDAAAFQITAPPSLQNNGGHAFMSVQGQLTRGTGNQELTLTFK